MRICLYETSHHETALAMLLLLGGQQTHVTMYTTATVAEHLLDALGDGYDGIRWVIRREDETARAFIRRMGTSLHAEAPDVLLLETVEANHYPIARAIKGLERTRVLLTIHDVHTNFRSRMRPSLRGIMRHWGKKALLGQVQGFITLSSSVRDHLKTILGDDRPVSWVPGAVFIPEQYVPVQLQEKKALRLVVPGSYDKRRRDYDAVFRHAADWESRGMDVQITLLGGQGPDSADILSSFRSWKGRHVRFIAFGEQEVDEKMFTRHMQESHFIWVPSVVDTIIADGIAETYGLSKSSGNLFDAIRHARPLIVPDALRVDPLQEKGCLRYASDDGLAGILQGLLNAPEGYRAILDKAHEVSRAYTVERIRARTPELGSLFDQA